MLNCFLYAEVYKFVACMDYSMRQTPEACMYLYLYLCVDSDTIKRQTWSVVLTVFAAVLAIKKCLWRQEEL